MTQTSLIETAKPSGSRSKSKKRIKPSEAEKETQVVEDDDIVQTYEPGNDFEYHPYDAPEEPQPHANVC